MQEFQTLSVVRTCLPLVAYRTQDLLNAHCGNIVYVQKICTPHVYRSGYFQVNYYFKQTVNAILRCDDVVFTLHLRVHFLSKLTHTKLIKLGFSGMHA